MEARDLRIRTCNSCNHAFEKGKRCPMHNSVAILRALERIEDLLKGQSVDLPMGVSQWRNHGKKYGYDEFFKKKDEPKKIAVIPVKSEGGAEKAPPQPKPIQDIKIPSPIQPKEPRPPTPYTKKRNKVKKVMLKDFLVNDHHVRKFQATWVVDLYLKGWDDTAIANATNTDEQRMAHYRQLLEEFERNQP